MAWFDVGAGLAEMGKTVAQTASVALLETYKSDLDKDRLKLANELAMERESKGRKEAHGYDMEKLDKTQAFQSGENEKERQNRITTTGMSVGGQLASTRMTIEARREEAALDRELRRAELELARVERREDRASREREGALDRESREGIIQKQIDAQAPERDASVAARNIDTAAKKFLLDARTEYKAAIDSGDSDRILKAKTSLTAAEFSASDDAKLATLQGSAVKIAEADLTSVRSKLTDFMSKNPAGPTTAEGKQLLADLQRQSAEAEKEYRAQAAKYKAMLDELHSARGAPRVSGSRTPLGSLPGAPGSAPNGSLPTTLPDQPQGLISFGGQ